MDTNNGKNIVLTKSDARFIADLIERYESSIKNIIYNTLGSEKIYLAEDTISEVYLLMCQKIEILKAHESPKAWVLVAAKRVAQGILAKNRREISTVPLDEVENHLGGTDVFEEAVYEIWLENKVPEKLIANLSKREREVYYKIYIEGKTPKETAEELDISLNAVHNIHKNLKDKIKYDIKRKNF